MESSSLCSNLSETLRRRALFEGLVHTANSSADVLCDSCGGEFQGFVEAAYRCEQANVRSYLSAQWRIGKESEGSTDSSPSADILSSLFEEREAERDLAGAAEGMSGDLCRLKPILTQITGESRGLQQQIDVEMRTMLAHEHDIALLQSDLTDMLALEDSARREMAYLGGVARQRCRVDPLMCLEEVEEGVMTVNGCRLWCEPPPGGRSEASRAWALLALCVVLLRNRAALGGNGQVQPRQCVLTRVNNGFDDDACTYFSISVRPLSDRALIVIKQSTRSNVEDSDVVRVDAISFECPAEDCGGEAAASYRRAIIALAVFVTAALEEMRLESCLEGRLVQIRSDLAGGNRIGFEQGTAEAAGGDLTELTRDIFLTIKKACGQT